MLNTHVIRIYPKSLDLFFVLFCFVLGVPCFGFGTFHITCVLSPNIWVSNIFLVSLLWTVGEFIPASFNLTYHISFPNNIPPFTKHYALYFKQFLSKSFLVLALQKFLILKNSITKHYALYFKQFPSKSFLVLTLQKFLSLKNSIYGQNKLYKCSIINILLLQGMITHYQTNKGDLLECTTTSFKN